MDESEFLEAVLDNPRDHAALLVYADWLEEQGNEVGAAKAEFLRLSAKSGEEYRKKKREKRLQALAATLDTDWLAVVSRIPVERCQGRRAAAEAGANLRKLLSFVCDRRWEGLAATDDRAVRFCDSCKQKVYYCDTITTARAHARARHCIAVDLGIIRRENDLEPGGAWLGMPGPELLREEEERMRPDPVSAERERKKRSR